MISLIHPSRGRPVKSRDTTLKWITKAGCDVELIVSIDNNDRLNNTYRDLYSSLSPFNVKIISNDNRSAVDAVNHAAKVASGNILIVVSDDSDCPDNWSRIIYECTSGKSDFVLKVYDGVQKWIVTMPIVDRIYYNRFGYIYHPDYSHMFVDTHFTHVADVLGRVIWRNDIVFPHLHYSVTRIKKDEVSEKADATWNQGKNLYLKHFIESFGLPGDVNVWNVSNDGHKKWLRDAMKLNA